MLFLLSILLTTKTSIATITNYFAPVIVEDDDKL